MTTAVKREEILAFSLEIDKIAKEKSIGILESVVQYCAESGLEIELVPKLLSPTLKTKIQREAEANHTIKRSGTRRLSGNK